MFVKSIDACRNLQDSVGCSIESDNHPTHEVSVPGTLQSEHVFPTEFGEGETIHNLCHAFD